MKRISFFFAGCGAIAAAFCGIVAAQTAGQTTPTVYYASQLGAVLDCNLSTNFTGAGCTNNDALINGVLATATSARPVKLIMNGGTVTNGVVIPASGNVTIECTGWDAGFVIASGSNAHMVRDNPVQWVYNWGTTPPAPGQNVTIRDCRFNGNQPGVGTGSTSWMAPNGNWLGGFYLDALTHVLIEHNWFYNIATYNVHLNACSDVVINDNRFDAVQGGPHQDGIHTDGPSSQIRIAHNWFNNSDNAIAMNATEGYGGPIYDVQMDSNDCELCINPYRQLANENGGSAVNQKVSGIVFTNGSGTLTDANGIWCSAFWLGESNGGGSLPDIQQDISISNSAYSTTSADCRFISIADNIGTISLSNVHWLNPTGAQPFLYFYSGATISNFVCRACGIHRSTSGNGAAFLATIPSGDSITRMDLDFSITNEQGQSYPADPYLIDVQSGGSIGTLFMNSVDPALSPTLLNGNEWSRVSHFYGPGVSTYYLDTTFANLPPASYPGLTASVSDSNGGGVWGATEGGGSPGHYAQENSNGSVWTVTGK